MATRIIAGDPPEKRVFGVSGSPRKSGNSDYLLGRILEGAKQEDVPVSRVRLADVQFQGCIGCEKCRKDKSCTGQIDGMSQLYPELFGAQGLVLVCPTHNYNVTAWMKAFIDRLYCFFDFETPRPGKWSSRLARQGRRAVLAAVCEQRTEIDMGYTLEAMRRPVEALGYDVVGELPVLGVFGRGDVRGQEEVLERAERLGRKLARSLM